MFWGGSVLWVRSGQGTISENSEMFRLMAWKTYMNLTLLLFFLPVQNFLYGFQVFGLQPLNSSHHQNRQVGVHQRSRPSKKSASIFEGENVFPV